MLVQEAFASRAAYDAHMVAVGAYTMFQAEEAAAEARRALALCALCPEAYNVLAVTASGSYEEALALYRKAEALGPQVGWGACCARRTCRRCVQHSSWACSRAAQPHALPAAHRSC
jgi:hypothetical protein